MEPTKIPTTNPQDLPIIPLLPTISQTIQQHPAAVIIGPTGSGKTTQVGLHLLKDGLAGDKRIGVTQPRRLAVISLAEYVSELYGCQVGQEVGYQVRFDDATMEGTKLKFMTDGILLQEAAHDPLFSRYNVLIFDEAHEQGLNTDIGLGLAKRAMQQRSDLKVIVMSATIDTGRFSEYFNQAPVITVEGRSYPITTQYLRPEEYGLAAKMFQEEGPQASLPALAAYKVHQIHFGKLSEEEINSNEILSSVPSGSDSRMTMLDNGDDKITTNDKRQTTNDTNRSQHILIFMPGKKEIAQTIELIEDMHLPDVFPLPAHSEMDQAEQQIIFEPTDKRKVIVATNIAETSITISDLAYVIDSGLIRQMIFDHKHGIGALKTIEHSKSGLRQREGRAGRTQPGMYLPLFTKSEFETGRPEYLEPGLTHRPEYSTPEIAREDLSSAVLRMKELGITDVENFDFLNSPAKGAVANAVTSLRTLGALDEAGFPTPVGRQMATLPVEPRIARMILEAENFGCMDEILTICSGLSTGTIFTRPIGLETQADEAREKLSDRRGDLFTLLKIIPLYQKQSDDTKEAWAATHYLNRHTLEEIIKIKDQLTNLMAELDIPITWLSSCQDPNQRRDLWKLQYLRIGQAITAGLLQNLAIKTSEREYTRANGQNVRIHPASVWSDKRPPLIVCSEFLEINSATFAVDVQAVELDWIKRIAPHLIRTRQVPLMHPWKGNVVGHYTVTTLQGVEIDRSYQGGQLPRHMMEADARQQQDGKKIKRSRNRHERRRNKNLGKRRQPSRHS